MFRLSVPATAVRRSVSAAVSRILSTATATTAAAAAARAPEQNRRGHQLDEVPDELGPGQHADQRAGGAGQGGRHVQVLRHPAGEEVKIRDWRQSSRRRGTDSDVILDTHRDNSCHLKDQELK